MSAGRNQIDVSVLNEKGAESLKESVSIIYDAPARKPNLYVVAVGVSDYQDERFRLTLLAQGRRRSGRPLREQLLLLRRGQRAAHRRRTVSRAAATPANGINCGRSEAWKTDAAKESWSSRRIGGWSYKSASTKMPGYPSRARTMS